MTADTSLAPWPMPCHSLVKARVAISLLQVCQIQQSVVRSARQPAAKGPVLVGECLPEWQLQRSNLDVVPIGHVSRQLRRRHNFLTPTRAHARGRKVLNLWNWKRKLAASLSAVLT